MSLPEDEAGYIALHIHTAKMDAESMYSALKHTTMIKEMIEKIEQYFNRKVDENSISYQRLVTHLRYAVSFYWNQMKRSIVWTRRCFISSKKVFICLSMCAGAGGVFEK